MCWRLDVRTTILTWYHLSHKGGMRVGVVGASSRSNGVCKGLEQDMELALELVDHGDFLIETAKQVSDVPTHVLEERVP